MDADSQFRTNSPPVIQETVDDETIIVNLVTGSYYSMNLVGSHVWGAIERGARVRDVIAGVVERFDADPAAAEPAVHDLIDELLREELILPATEAGGNGAAAVEPAQRNGSPPPASYEAPVLKKYTDMQELLMLDPVHEVDEAGWPEPL